MIYKHFPKNDSPRPPRRTGQAGSAPLHEKKECLAKKGNRQGRKKSLCAFPTLRLCVNKKRISPRPPRRTGLAGFAPSREKNRSPRNAAGQAAKKGRHQNQDSFASLRLCVNLLFLKNQSEIPSSSLNSNQDNSSSSNSPSMA